MGSDESKTKDIASSPYYKVLEFHETYGMGISASPTLEIPSKEMRFSLVEEELSEYREALDAEDIVKIADALADLVYVIYGAAIEHGINLDEVIDEVHKSNLSKLHHETGQPIYREDGKVLKGQNYVPPDIARVLKNQGFQ
jgi:predicted HAD superfamily Cof-like phosphohydrolase